MWDEWQNWQVECQMTLAEYLAGDKAGGGEFVGPEGERGHERVKQVEGTGGWDGRVHRDLIDDPLPVSIGGLDRQ